MKGCWFKEQRMDKRASSRDPFAQFAPSLWKCVSSHKIKTWRPQITDFWQILTVYDDDELPFSHPQKIRAIMTTIGILSDQKAFILTKMLLRNQTPKPQSSWKWEEPFLPTRFPSPWSSASWFSESVSLFDSTDTSSCMIHRDRRRQRSLILGSRVKRERDEGHNFKLYDYDGLWLNKKDEEEKKWKDQEEKMMLILSENSLIWSSWRVEQETSLLKSATWIKVRDNRMLNDVHDLQMVPNNNRLLFSIFIFSQCEDEWMRNFWLEKQQLTPSSSFSGKKELKRVGSDEREISRWEKKWMVGGETGLGCSDFFFSLLFWSILTSS